MNVRIFWVGAMKCMCAQTRPRFILSSERVFGGMEFEPMLTPREKSPLPENVPRGGLNPRHRGQRAQALPTELFWPQIWRWNMHSVKMEQIAIILYFGFNYARRIVILKMKYAYCPNGTDNYKEYSFSLSSVRCNRRWWQLARCSCSGRACKREGRSSHPKKETTSPMNFATVCAR